MRPCKLQKTEKLVFFLFPRRGWSKCVREWVRILVPTIFSVIYCSDHESIVKQGEKSNKHQESILFVAKMLQTKNHKHDSLCICGISDVVYQHRVSFASRLVGQMSDQKVNQQYKPTKSTCVLHCGNRIAFANPGTIFLAVYLSFMMTSSNGNIFRVTGPLCGEFTVHRWIPLTKASDAELWCLLWSASE